jgi:hypothetical protein
MKTPAVIFKPIALPKHVQPMPACASKEEYQERFSEAKRNTKFLEKNVETIFQNFQTWLDKSSTTKLFYLAPNKAIKPSIGNEIWKDRSVHRTYYYAKQAFYLCLKVNIYMKHPDLSRTEREEIIKTETKIRDTLTKVINQTLARIPSDIENFVDIKNVDLTMQCIEQQALLAEAIQNEFNHIKTDAEINRAEEIFNSRQRLKKIQLTSPATLEQEGTNGLRIMGDDAYRKVLVKINQIKNGLSVDEKNPRELDQLMKPVTMMEMIVNPGSVKDIDVTKKTKLTLKNLMKQVGFFKHGNVLDEKRIESIKSTIKALSEILENNKIPVDAKSAAINVAADSVNLDKKESAIKLYASINQLITGKHSFSSNREALKGLISMSNHLLELITNQNGGGGSKTDE